MDGLNTVKNIVTCSYSLASQLEAVAIVVDVTQSPEIGSETVYICIQYGKDIVIRIIKADPRVGCILKKHIDLTGEIYMVAYGNDLVAYWCFINSSETRAKGL